MAGKRRYMPDEADADKYRYYAKDHLGSVIAMTDHEQNKELYSYDAWGEHVDTTNLPSTPNNVRYGGARLECFAFSGTPPDALSGTPQDALSGTPQDAIYHCGERHYWPAYGRFLHRDRMTWQKLPPPSLPLASNPYIYAV